MRMASRYLSLISVMIVMISCGEYQDSALVFVEKSNPGPQPESRASDTSALRNDQVRLSELPAEKIVVCILPYRNNSLYDELNALDELLRLSFESKLENYQQIIDPIIMESNEYFSEIQQIGFDDYIDPDINIASVIGQKLKADYVIYGNIEIEGEQIIIKTFLATLASGFRESQLASQAVDLVNIIKVLDPYVQRVLDMIVAYEYRGEE